MTQMRVPQSYFARGSPKEQGVSSQETNLPGPYLVLFLDWYCFLCPGMIWGQRKIRGTDQSHLPKNPNRISR